MNRIDELFRKKLSSTQEAASAADLRDFEQLLAGKKKRRLGAWWWFAIVLLCGSAIGLGIFNYTANRHLAVIDKQDQSATDTSNINAASTSKSGDDTLNPIQKIQVNDSNNHSISDAIANKINDAIANINGDSNNDSVVDRNQIDLTDNKVELRNNKRSLSKAKQGQSTKDVKPSNNDQEPVKPKLNDTIDLHFVEQKNNDDHNSNDIKTIKDDNKEFDVVADLPLSKQNEGAIKSDTTIQSDNELLQPSDTISVGTILNDSLDAEDDKFWELQIGLGYNQLQSMNEVLFALPDTAFRNKIDWWQRDIGLRCNCGQYQFGLTFSIAEYQRTIGPERYYTQREYYKNVQGEITTINLYKPAVESFLSNYSAVQNLQQWSLSPMLGYHLLKPESKWDVLPKLAVNIELNRIDKRYYERGTTEYVIESPDSVESDYAIWFEPRLSTETSYSISGNAAVELRRKFGTRIYALAEPGFRYQLWSNKKDITPKLMSYYVRFGVGFNF